jgi:DNA-binding response OmpR family regulator
MVIMDTVTPDGVDLLTLDSIRKHTNAPIIILTSDNEVETLRTVFAHGADDFIRKPFGVKSLIARVKAKLRRSRQEIRPVIVFQSPSPNEG